MSLTEIILRLFAWLRPLLWYSHRLGHLLRVALLYWADDDSLIWLRDHPEARSDFEAKLIDGEHALDIIIGLRAKEILGLAVLPEDRPGIRQLARIHSAPSLERLAGRLSRLVDRYEDIERLACLRASRLRREIAAAACRLEPDHRPQALQPGALDSLLLLLLLHSPFAVAAGLRLAPSLTDTRIRAPP